MPKKMPVQVNEASSSNWKGYVNWNITESQKEHVKEYAKSSTFDVPDLILRFIEEGYAVGFSWDGTSKCMRMTVTGKTAPCPNIGWALSLRHADVTRLVAMAAVYVFVMYPNMAWPVNPLSELDW